MRTSLPGMVIGSAATLLSACSALVVKPEVVDTDPGNAPAETDTGEPPFLSETGILDPGATGDTEDSGPAQGTAVCGDGIRQATEVCDGGDHGGRTCVTEGFWTGDLVCTNCAFDTSGCVAASAGGTWCDTTRYTIPHRPSGLLVPDPVEATLTVPDQGPVGAVQVSLKGSHEWLGELNIFLDHGGSTVQLADPDALYGDCDTEGTIDVTWGDALAGDHEECSSNGDYLGTRVPMEPLAAFAGADMTGDWTLRIVDLAWSDGGTFTEWCVTVTPPAATPTP